MYKLIKVYFRHRNLNPSHRNLNLRLTKEPKASQYTGFVYCLSVPNHTMVVERNGKVIICGNSYDGGSLENDKIGDLSDYIVINPTIAENECSVARFVAWFLNGISKLFQRRTRFNIFSFAETQNLVDAALCKSISMDIVSSEVEGIGVSAGTMEAELGQSVVKSGRTTAITRGHIEQVDVSVNVGYGDSRTALFEDQIIVKGLEGQSFSSGGIVARLSSLMMETY